MPHPRGLQSGLTMLECLVAAGLVTAGAILAWQYYDTEITGYLAMATAALESFVTS